MVNIQTVFRTAVIAVLATLCGVAGLQGAYAHDFGKSRPFEIIILETMTLQAVQDRTTALRARLDEIGYHQGDTVNIRVYNADKDTAKGEQLLRAAIAERKPDLVVSVATVASQSTRAVLKGSDIPQIFMFVSDPVRAGVIDTIGQPSGVNVAGHVHMLPRDVHLNMIMRLLTQVDDRRPVQIGLLHSSYPSSVGMKDKMLEAARQRGDVAIHTFEIEQLSMTDGMAQMLTQAEQGIRELEAKADYIWLGEGPLGRNAAFVDRSLRMATKPVVAGASMDGARAGILITLDSNPKDDAREAALLVNAVLKGQDPGIIPVMRTSSYRVGVNLGTAKKLGIEIPPDLLTIAGEDVYR